MIKVLVVDDSTVARELLVHILRSDPAIEVVGTAKNGKEALEAVLQTNPDLVTMDFHMPTMNGLDATRRIMETHPVPIIIVSASCNIRETVTSFHAMEAGALAAVSRPPGIGHRDHERAVKEFLLTVKLLSEVKVVRRWPRKERDSAAIRIEVKKAETEIRLIAIGASTGGPLAIQTILAGLPKDLSVPLLIVQHMSSGFVHGFAEWLTQTTGFPTHVAVDNEHPRAGHAYVAPDTHHMGVKVGNRILLSEDPPEKGVRPSVSFLFRSVTRIHGRNAIGVLLTGMGKDGAAELKLLKESGAVTIAQDGKSTIVNGMPGEAVQIGATVYVFPPEKIAAALVCIVNNREMDTSRAG